MSEIASFHDVGTIVPVPCAMKCFVWKIKNCFTLIRNSNQRITSPPFMFLDAFWYLSLYEKDEKKLNSDRWIGLYLIKKHSVPPCGVDYTFEIRRANGSSYQIWRSAQHFNEGGRGHGCARFLKRAQIEDHRAAPFGNLTVYCILRGDIMNSCEMTTQTDCHEGKDGCARSSGEDLYEEKNEKVSPNPSGLDKTWQDFKDLLVSGEDSDVIVRVKDQEFKVHKLILKTRSPVFRSMFQHPMKEETSGIIDITDCDPVAFKDFLCYLYCGRVERLSTNNVFDLYRIGDKYEVEDLKEKCTEFMMDEISVNSFPEVITLAMQHDESALIEMATSFFIENAPEITEAAKWLSFVTEHPAEANELFRKTLKLPKK